MTFGLTRRTIVAAGLGLPLHAALINAGMPTRTEAAEAGGLPRLGPPEPFDFAKVKEMARRRAAAPYVDHPPRYSDLLEAIDFDAAQKMTYRDAAALWPQGTGSFPVKLFHLHRYAKDPVRIFQVKHGSAREVLYDDALFAYGASPASVSSKPMVAATGSNSRAPAIFVRQGSSGNMVPRLAGSPSTPSARHLRNSRSSRPSGSRSRRTDRAA